MDGTCVLVYTIFILIYIKLIVSIILAVFNRCPIKGTFKRFSGSLRILKTNENFTGDVDYVDIEGI